jgi:hypothetical protein
MTATFHRTFVTSLSRVRWVGVTVSLIAFSNANAQTIATPSPTEKAAVDALIPWLLQEDAQLRGIPFSEVIFDATGKRVLAFNPKDETDARVAKQIGAVFDEVMTRLNASASTIQGIARINEVSSHFEDLIRELLNKTPGLTCDFPKTAAGGKQRSGYPDLELIEQQSHRVYYLDPKLYAVGSRDSSFRTFYFEPKIATNKVREDAVHFIVGFEHEKPAGDRHWKFTRWDLVDLSHFQVKLKAEFQGSNRDMYRPEAIVASSANKSE